MEFVKQPMNPNTVISFADINEHGRDRVVEVATNKGDQTKNSVISGAGLGESKLNT